MEKTAKNQAEVTSKDGAGSERSQNNKSRNAAATLAFSAALLLPFAAEASPPEIIPIETIDTKEINANDFLAVSLHDGNGIVDLAEAILGPEVSKNDRQQVAELTLDIMELNGLPRDMDSVEARTIPAGTQIIIPIKAENPYVIKYGDNPSDLWRSLGYKDAGYTKLEYAQANAIIDINKIYPEDKQNYAPGYGPEATTAANDLPPEPEQPVSGTNQTPPVLPPSSKNKDELIAPPMKPEPELDVPPVENQDVVTISAAVTEINELSQTAGTLEIAQPEIENFNGAVLDETEAEEALDLLIKATEKYENPLAGYRVSIQELQPTPVANRLMENRSVYIDDLASGKINLAYIQSHIINELATRSAVNNKDTIKNIIAGQLLDVVADKYGWIMDQVEIDYLTSLMLQGTDSFEYSNTNRAYNDARSLNRLDQQSLTLYLFNEAIEQHIADQVEIAALADEQLEALAPSLKDLDETELENIVKSMVFARQKDGSANDYLHDVLVAKLDGSSIEEGLALVREGVLSSQLSTDLPGLFPSLETELATYTSQFIALEGVKELGGLISEYEQALDTKITEISEYSATLDGEQAVIDELNPDLPELDEAVLYKVAKTILSQQETSQKTTDEWYQLIEAKALAAELSNEQVIRGLVERIYITSSAGLLLEDSQAERATVDASVKDFMAGETKNLEEYLSGTFESLEARITESVKKVESIIDAVTVAVPELLIQDTELLAFAIDYLSVQDSGLLADKIVSSHIELAGQVLSETQEAIIDLELIKIDQSDETKRAEEIKTYLTEFYTSRNALTSIENIRTQGDVAVTTPTSYKPVLATLTNMVSGGKYVVQYADGTSLDVFSGQFLDRMSRYDGTPESIFEGNSFRIAGYGGQDLRPFFEYLKISGQAVMDDPYNFGLSLDGEAIVSDGKSPIWFNEVLFPSLEQANLEAATEWVYGEIPGFKYPVKKGDTLAEIAQMFRHKDSGRAPTIDELLMHNRGRIEHEDWILVGQEIVIPADYNVYIDSLENPDVIEVNINADAGGAEKPSTSQSSPTPETIPAGAEIKKADLGSLGTIEIVQLNDTFKTSNEMNPTAIINHWSGSDYDDANPLENFLNGIKGNNACPNGCSVHFFVSEQGVIYQLSLLDSQLAHAKGANSFGIGIEAEDHWGNDGMPNDKQYDALLQLNAFIVQERDLSLDHSIENKTGVLGHYEVDGSYLDPEDSGKTDPGKKYMQKLRADLDVWANPVVIQTGSPETTSGNLAAEHERIKNKVENELKSLPTYSNPYGLSASDIKPPELVFTVDEMAQNRLDKDATGNSWDTYIGPSEGTREVMEALIVYGGLHEVDAPGWTTDELLVAATATIMGEGGGYTHIVGDLKLEDGAVLDPTDNISYKDEIVSISPSSEQFYWTNELDGSSRDPELVGNDHRIAANRAGQMIRQELAAGRPVLDKWHYYRDWEEEHAEAYQNHVAYAQEALAAIKAGS